MNPQNNNGAGGQSPNFDGFGGPNISYENYTETPVPTAPQPAPQQINVVNANGVISGHRMVDYIWKRLAYCGFVFSVVFLIGLIAAVIIAGMANSNAARAEAEKAATSRNLQGLYTVIGVENQEDAIQALDKESEYINGGDLAKIDKLLAGKYGEYVVDYADSNINFIRINNMFKVVSVGIMRPDGTIRVILYTRIADGNWKLGGFDSTNSTDPCANSPFEEKKAIKGLVSCKEKEEEKEDPEPEEPEEPEEKTEEKPEEDKEEKKTEEGGSEKEKETTK